MTNAAEDGLESIEIKRDRAAEGHVVSLSSSRRPFGAGCPSTLRDLRPRSTGDLACQQGIPLDRQMRAMLFESANRHDEDGIGRLPRYDRARLHP